ncbi:MAG: hypothetical protein E6L00_00335 [Thaumarchaeota archaeon]|nr:MAG: hypothetical protein E6L02_00770 [Nitrososphaerota archaeon]TLX83667.1 MAG: hypothetical protein E6L00_00335 [Nitrososphaerota archaeon]
MRQKKLLYAGICVATVVAGIIIILTQFPSISNQSTNNTDQSQISPLDLDFSYEEANSNLKATLLSHDINMSKPLRFSSQSDINRYCNFFSNEKRQALVKYCTSSEIKDKNGNFLGNINMVGSTRAPGLVISALHSDPLLSNLNDVKIIFEAVINETICTCWDQVKPGGYSTLSDMINAQRDFQITGKQPTSASNTIPLGTEHFRIELTTNQQGYVWKLLVAR